MTCVRIKKNLFSAVPCACDFQNYISDLSFAATNVRWTYFFFNDST